MRPLLRVGSTRGLRSVHSHWRRRQRQAAGRSPAASFRTAAHSQFLKTPRSLSYESRCRNHSTPAPTSEASRKSRVMLSSSPSPSRSFGSGMSRSGSARTRLMRRKWSAMPLAPPSPGSAASSAASRWASAWRARASRSASRSSRPCSSAQSSARSNASAGCTSFCSSGSSASSASSARLGTRRSATARFQWAVQLSSDRKCGERTVSPSRSITSQTSVGRPWRASA